jgi:hypothetical protein
MRKLLFTALTLLAGPAFAQVECMSLPKATGLEMTLSQDRKTMEFRNSYSSDKRLGCLLELDCTVRPGAQSVQYRAPSQKPGWEGVVNDIKQFTFKFADGAEQVCAVVRATQVRPELHLPFK